MSWFKKLANACRAYNGEEDIRVKKEWEDFEKEWDKHNCWHCQHLRWRKTDSYVNPKEYFCVAPDKYGQNLGEDEKRLNNGHNFCDDFMKKRSD